MDYEFIKLELFPQLKLDGDKIDNKEVNNNIGDDTAIPKIPDSFFKEPIVDDDLSKKIKDIIS